jgi:hypothetical protein
MFLDNHCAITKYRVKTVHDILVSMYSTSLYMVGYFQKTLLVPYTAKIMKTKNDANWHHLLSTFGDPLLKTLYLSV